MTRDCIALLGEFGFETRARGALLGMTSRRDAQIKSPPAADAVVPCFR